MLVVVDVDGALYIFKVLREVYLDRKLSLAVADARNRVLRGAGEGGALGEINLVEEEEAGVKGKGKSTLVFLPVPLDVTKN